jgi:hypothetical protein
MIGLLGFVLAVLTSPFKSRLRLEAENAVLRHQLMVLRRRGTPIGASGNFNSSFYLVQLLRYDLPMLVCPVRIAASDIVNQ